MGSNFTVVTTDLIKLFNNNPRWKNIDMNLHEASNISVAIAVLKLNGENFIGDIGDIIRMKLNTAHPEDLPNLAKSSHYMRNYKYSVDLYSHVHAQAMTMHNSGKLPS